MRTAFLPFLIGTIAPAAAAQFHTVDVAWERLLEHPTFEGMHPIEVEAAPDGGVLVVGLARDLPLDDFQRPAEVVLTKLDENGDLEWSDAIDSPPFPTVNFTAGRYADAVFDAQGDAFVVASRPGSSLLRRYNVDGGLVWQADLPLRSGGGSGPWQEYIAGWVDLAPSGDVIVCGFVMQGWYPRADVRAFGPDGTPRWEWRGDAGGAGFNGAQGYPLGLAVGPGGVIYVHGRSDAPFFQSDGLIIALSAGGSLLWRAQTFNTEAGFIDVDFNGQGQLVALRHTVSVSSGSFRVITFHPDGTQVSEVPYSEPGYRIGATAVVVDAFDRITVGGWRGPSGGLVREASMFRFDAAGAFLGRVVPSVVGPGEDGYLQGLVVTPRNDVVAFGVSGTGQSQVILSRFGRDGAERWSERRRGQRPLASGSPSVELGFAADPRGNLFTLAQTIEGGVAPNQSLGIDAVKHVQNGPAGSSYCGPAPLNSTGAPAALRALGPSLLSANNVTLRADGLPTGALTLLLTSRIQGSVPSVGGGQGTLCLGGAIGRFFGPGQVRMAGGDGSAALQLHVNQLPQPTGSVAATVGETWSFQAWYRDANPGPTSNLTDAVEVTFQ
jgi:hypothetical protein